MKNQGNTFLSENGRRKCYEFETIGQEQKLAIVKNAAKIGFKEAAEIAEVHYRVAGEQREQRGGAAVQRGRAALTLCSGGSGVGPR